MAQLNAAWLLPYIDFTDYTLGEQKDPNTSQIQQKNNPTYLYKVGPLPTSYKPPRYTPVEKCGDAINFSDIGICTPIHRH